MKMLPVNTVDYFTPVPCQLSTSVTELNNLAGGQKMNMLLVNTVELLLSSALSISNLTTELSHQPQQFIVGTEIGIYCLIQMNYLENSPSELK